MLQACLNGGRSKDENPAVPVSPDELAADAAAVREAGATTLHLHPRNAAGRESLDPDDVGRCLDAVRAAVPGMPVGIGTGAWIEPKHAARLEHMRAWETVPDYASVNLNEADAPETIAILHDKGIGVEAGLWSVIDAERLIDIGEAASCLRLLIEMTTDDAARAKADYHAIRALLDRAHVTVPILLHGEGGSVWPMVALAGREGHDTRVGFEDGLHLPDGASASSNADIVRAAVEVLSRQS